MGDDRKGCNIASGQGKKRGSSDREISRRRKSAMRRYHGAVREGQGKELKSA